MSKIVEATPRGIVVAGPMREISADLRVFIEVSASGVPVAARDLTPDRVSEARTIADQGLAPAPQELVLAWLNDLGRRVVNAPDQGNAAACSTRILWETCEDFPAGVWSRETLKAWITQGPQGKFWPAPAELYAHLQPYADQLRRNVEGCRRIVRLAERAGKREDGISAEERAAVARQMAEWRKSMGHADAEPERRRPVQPQPSASERLAECRRQLAADPAQAAWLEPLIAQLEAQVMATYGKEPAGKPHSAAQVFAR